jgi:hypothetical protein
VVRVRGHRRPVVEEVGVVVALQGDRRLVHRDEVLRQVRVAGQRGETSVFGFRV